MDILIKIIIIVISVIVPGTLYLIFINRSLINQIRRTPIYLIKELPPKGKVSFIGKANTNTQISPITETHCVYFNCYVQEIKFFGDDHDPHLVTIFKDSSKEPLLIGDESGHIRVDLDHANIILEPDLQEIVTADTHLELHNKLSNWGINISSDQGKAKSYSVHEEFISADDQIYILGHVRQNDGNRIITSKWNNQAIVSDSSQSDLVKIYSNQSNQVVKFLPISFLVIIIILLAEILFCKVPLP